MPLGEVELEVVAVADGARDDEDEPDAAEEVGRCPVEEVEVRAVVERLRPVEEAFVGEDGEARSRVARHRFEEAFREAHRRLPEEAPDEEGEGPDGHRGQPNESQEERVLPFPEARAGLPVDEGEVEGETDGDRA